MEEQSKKQLVTLAWESDPNQKISFDATAKEDHNSRSDLSDHPAEEGSDFSDHIRRMQDELSLTNAIVSDHPLRPSKASTGEDSKSRSVSAYRWLRRTKDRGEVVRVFTTLNDYRNMAIVSLGVTRDVRTSRIVDARIGLRELLTAITEQVSSPEPSNATSKSRKGKKNRGKKSKKKESEVNKKKARASLLSRKFGDQVTGFLDRGPF